MTRITGKQLPIDIEAIAALTTPGLVDRTGPGTAATRATGATGLQVLAAAGAAEARSAIGLGTIATQNESELTVRRNVAGQSAQLRLFGSAPFGNDQNNGVVFSLPANLPGNRQIAFYASDDDPSNGAALRCLFFGPYAAIDAVSPNGFFRKSLFLGSPTESLGLTVPPENTAVVATQGQSGKSIFRARRTDGSAAAEITENGNLYLYSGLQINSGATLTDIRTATKTAAATNPETITVTGAQVGDIVYLSEAVPAKVTAANTVSFNGTGLSGTIRAVVMRFS